MLPAKITSFQGWQTLFLTWWLLGNTVGKNHDNIFLKAWWNKGRRGVFVSHLVAADRGSCYSEYLHSMWFFLVDLVIKYLAERHECHGPQASQGRCTGTWRKVPTVPLWAVWAVPSGGAVEEVTSAHLRVVARRGARNLRLCYFYMPCAWFLQKKTLPVCLLFEGTDVLTSKVSSLLLGALSDCVNQRDAN